MGNGPASLLARLAGRRDTGARSSVPPEDAADVRAAQRGDREAFARLYDRHVERIYRYAYYRTRNEAEAEDVTSDVFFRALGSLPRYEPREAFAAWIYRIARNVAIDRARARAVRTQVPFEDVLDHPDAGDVTLDPDVALAASDRRERLRAAIARLTPGQQHVLILRFIEGLETDEIASLMHRDPSTIRSLQMRALRALRERVSPEDLR